MALRKWMSLVAVFALVLSACTAAPATPPPGTDPPGTPPPTSPDPGTPDPGTPDPGTPDPDSPAPTSPEPTEGTGEPQVGGTLEFAGSRVAASLDPSQTSDGESFRILQQIYEPLVDLAEGSVSEIVGVLAESWTGNPEDTTYVFTLRQGVTFHDGTPFNAEAVKINFDRWQNFAAEFQPTAYYYGAVMGGFGENLIESVEATDEYTVTFTLRQPKADFVQGIALTPFSIVSPAVLEATNADDPATSTFGTDVTQGGTGPFRWESYTPGESGSATLVRNEEYWGDPADGPFLDRLIIQAIPNASARLQSLQSPDGVQGMDLVAPTEYGIVEGDPNLTLLERLSYNTLYLGLNPTASEDSPLQEVAVRQAVAHAIDKAALIEPFYGGRGQPADIFVPPTSEWHDALRQDVPVYEFNPDTARQLLADAGFGPDNPPTIEFWFPTEVTRPYMPDPAGLAQAVITMLEEVGFDVTPNSAVWSPDYLAAASAGSYDLHFLGWTGDYDDPWNWYGYHFDLQDGEPQTKFNCDPEGLRDAFTTANSSFDVESRGAAFNEVASIIHENACFVTIAHGDTALAFKPGVNGYVAAPTGSESFKTVWLSQP